MIKEGLEWLSGKINPVVKLSDGREVSHSSYSVIEDNRGKNFQHPIARHVINQDIVSKYDFIEFINEYKGDATKIFFNERMIKAVFNYSTKDDADHGDSYVRMELDKTRDFQEFESLIDRAIPQKQFVRALKRLEPFIVGFDGKKVDDMDIIEVAENLQATKNFTSVQRNASQAFMVDAEVKAGNANYTLPRYIDFELPVYKNDLLMKKVFQVELFLDAGDGQFEATLACYKLEQTIEETIKELTKQVCEGCDNVDSFMI